MSVSADAKKAFIQFPGALSFVLVTGCAHAIDDSGGCATNRDLVDTLSSGPAAALTSHLAAQVVARGRFASGRTRCARVVGD